MKTILVPVDFSDVSEKALEYAISLNKYLKGKILLFHTYLIPVPATDIPLIAISEDEIHKSALKSVNQLKKKYADLHPDMQFETRVISGFPETEIIKQEKAHKCDLVVMGTHGATGLREYLVGTNTAAVAEDSVCPVISVPEKLTIKRTEKIVFAANYGSDDFMNISGIIHFAKQLDAEVVLLHIASKEIDNTFEFAELEGFYQQVKKENNFERITFKLLEDDDVSHGLLTYLDEINADMLAMNMRNRSFLQKIFTRSLTKKMAYHSQIPVMVIHTSV